MPCEPAGMVNIERPCCDQPLAVETPVPDALTCEDCQVSWSLVDPQPEALALAA